MVTVDPRDAASLKEKAELEKKLLTAESQCTKLEQDLLFKIKRCNELKAELNKATVAGSAEAGQYKKSLKQATSARATAEHAVGLKRKEIKALQGQIRHIENKMNPKRKSNA